MRKHTSNLLALPLLALLLLLFSCSGDDDDDTDAGDDDTLATQTPDAGDDDTVSPTPLEYPYEKQLYLRGPFNNWTDDETELEPYKMNIIAPETLYAETELAFGSRKFKIADNQWSSGTNFGNPAGTEDHLTLGEPKTMGDNGFDLYLDLETSGIYSFTVDTTERLEPVVVVELVQEIEDLCAPNLDSAKARWMDADTLVWKTKEATGYRLYYAPEGGITLDAEILAGLTSYDLTPIGTIDTEDPLYEKYPYLKNQTKYDTSALAEELPDMLQGEVIVASIDENGEVCDATGIQLYGVLDDLYTYSGDDLGVTFGSSGEPTFKLWAPTAKSVNFLLYDSSDAADPSATEAMTRDDSGVWSVTGDSSWTGKYYLFEVEVYVRTEDSVETNRVTDPYSHSLSMNSARTQIIDLTDPALEPDGWADLSKPDLDAPEDIVLYELHIRDFSANDSSCTEEKRGKFAAFTELNADDEPTSDGMSHLEGLADAGLTHVHLLPAFDIATIEEDGSLQQVADIPTDAGPASEEQQAAVTEVKDNDAFNWGYDPYHYMVPEGSYSSDPDGSTRVLEFRKMVQGLSDIGLRVVMDQVYNHTNSAGQNEKSVLDKIVPGYYYRLDEEGNVQSSTCCPDTATEHAMMEKLMIDSVLMWATQYKVDGFRFDLMGHHTTENMQHLREALDALTVEADGVDGSKIYIYGEGWKFGSLDDILPDQAFSQPNTYGYGIGSFNDRIRDSIRGGSPFAELSEQGFATGMYYDDNYLGMGEMDESEYLEAELETLLNLTDNVRIGLAGNLRDYSFMGADGEMVTGADIEYRGTVGAGYTADPQEDINYVSVHDNQTLFDNIQAKAPFELESRDPVTADLDERVRMQNLSMSIIALAQGVPFFHAGSDMLRSKSGDKDSYNSGDWFNKLDFTYASNNWGVGLPIADKNEGDWDFWGERLIDETILPGSDQIQAAMDHFKVLLEIRSSSPLFRLRTAADVEARLSFLNAEAGTDQIPGLIVMYLSDEVDGSEDLDGEYEAIVTLFNATTEDITFSHDLLKASFTLHPVQQGSADAVVAAASCGSGDGNVTIPARTTMVCVR